MRNFSFNELTNLTVNQFDSEIVGKKFNFEISSEGFPSFEATVLDLILSVDGLPGDLKISNEDGKEESLPLLKIKSAQYIIN